MMSEGGEFKIKGAAEPDASSDLQEEDRAPAPEPKPKPESPQQVVLFAYDVPSLLANNGVG